MKENEKQAIEEMAKVIETTEQIARDAHCGLPSPTMYAKDLYWRGYRRQRDGEWGFKGTAYGCTLCGYGVIAPIYNYCPNCGAHMKVGEE